MRLGIDFGTTRTVVAHVDRGNYPVVSFETEAGEDRPWVPSWVAVRGDEVHFGLAAEAMRGLPGWTLSSALKRSLGIAGPESTLELAGRPWPVLDLLSGFLDRLRQDLLERSNLGISAGEAFEATVAVPANAPSNQRFLTLEAFRRAGFTVLGLLNEPSAAGLEYAQGQAAKGGVPGREVLLVYDFGGGTFDASVIRREGRAHEVLGHDGIAELGGADFDQLLLDLAFEAAGHPGPISDAARFALLEECRERKEGMNANTRKIVVDLGVGLEGAGEVIVAAADFLARSEPLVERTVAAAEAAFEQCAAMTGADWRELGAVYMVGGTSDLPAVPRLLRERWGRRVKRSPYPRSATAIGLAVAADGAAGWALKECFTRHFGLWREADGGSRLVFDPIFKKGTPLPAAGEEPLLCHRRYQPAHSAGYYRFLEASHLSPAGEPAGDLQPFDEALFPYLPELEGRERLEPSAIERLPAPLPHWIEEEYRCDAAGMIEAKISNLGTGHSRSFRLRQPG